MPLGQSNYGKRRISDKTHKRLFSVCSFKKLLIQYGFKIETIKGFAPPLTELVSSSKVMKILENIHTFFSRRFLNLFAYNFLIIATRMDGLADILEMTINNKKQQGICESIRAPRVDKVKYFYQHQ